MKRIVVIVAGMLLVSSVALAAEQSPDPSHVKVVSVPRQCIENGSAERGGFKYTCSKVDSSEVWNEVELRKFDKDIFEAYKQESSTRIGLVVRQDTVQTAVQQVETEKNEVALVERRDGYKYRYARR
jgi:hypothetical protein